MTLFCDHCKKPTKSTLMLGEGATFLCSDCWHKLLARGDPEDEAAETCAICEVGVLPDHRILYCRVCANDDLVRQETLRIMENNNRRLTGERDVARSQHKQAVENRQYWMDQFDKAERERDAALASCTEWEADQTIDEDEIRELKAEQQKLIGERDGAKDGKFELEVRLEKLEYELGAVEAERDKAVASQQFYEVRIATLIRDRNAAGTKADQVASDLIRVRSENAHLRSAMATLTGGRQ